MELESTGRSITNKVTEISFICNHRGRNRFSIVIKKIETNIMSPMKPRSPVTSIHVLCEDTSSRSSLSC